MKRRRKRNRRRPRKRSSKKLGSRILLLTLFSGLVMVLALRWIESPPRNPEDACAIFREKPSWHDSLRRSEKTWGTPKAIQLAILFQESSFRARIRPPRNKILWILPWRRPSTAYGYGQILDGTWKDYQQRRKRPDAKRNSFDDVTDFVGWYTDQIHRTTRVAKTDASNLYLAYHEGPTGFSRGSHKKKTWLQSVAKEVSYRASRYQQQLSKCEASLQWNRLLRRIIKVLLILIAATFLLFLMRRRLRGSRL